MHLEKITVQNFKGLKTADFSPTNFGCIVSENNAGKSTVLQAIVYSLNRPSTMSLDLFYDPTAPVIFRCTFTNITPRQLRRLTDEQRGKIEPLVNDGTLTLIVRYRPSEKCEVMILQSIPAEVRYTKARIAEVFAGKRGAALQLALDENYPEFSQGAPALTTISACKEYVSLQVGLIQGVQRVDSEQPLPTGMSSSITNLLPEPIYIPAVRSLSDDIKTTQTTPFGRLLGLLFEDMTADLAAITAMFTDLNNLLNRQVGHDGVKDDRHGKVQAMERRIQSLLQENFPSAKVELDIPPPELRSILNSAKIYVDDGSRDLIDNKGDGIKRSLTFALLQAYVEQTANINDEAEDAPAPRPMIFLFEEPELYLHPRSQRILFSTLAKISCSHQVVVTTHSPNFFAPGVTASFVRIAKVMADPKPFGKLFPVVFSLDLRNAETFKMARFEHADAAFFSNRVVLFEGESDDTYCRHIAPLMNFDWDFDKKNVALVKVNGKGNFARFRQFFEGFGIEVKIVADLDALFEGYTHLGGDVQANELRSTAFQTIDENIIARNIRAEPLSRQIKDHVQRETWKNRYNLAKETLRKIQGGEPVTQETVRLIDGLFTWEEDTARLQACISDPPSAAAIIPLLDHLRASGICVLAKGAIEDYYPPAAPTSGSKPERALKACELVKSGEDADRLCNALSVGRNHELHEVFGEIFKDI